VRRRRGGGGELRSEGPPFRNPTLARKEEKEKSRETRLARWNSQLQFSMNFSAKGKVVVAREKKKMKRVGYRGGIYAYHKGEKGKKGRKPKKWTS